MPSTTFVFFRPIGKKTKWPPWPLIGRDIFDFSSETAERNLTKLDRKQDLNALYQVCIFQVDWKNKMAAPAYDLLRHFQLFLWNRWIEFNKTWQEARSQHPQPGLRFSGWSEKQDSRPFLWLAETYFDFSSETTEGNSAKLDRKQNLNVLYQVWKYSNDLEACGMKCCYFWFHSKFFLRWASVALWASCLHCNRLNYDNL